ncbi:SpoIVB peptidase [Desulforamulus aeronauticus]|uniref:Stage IV sporulation protein B n=1 Tax=Desulforamulus aeronauticus DSM 10349 TaxID=1121421 RepID=A0A1M6PEH8_9FIRM|nr:SpoIVB peptidase [Desulforamulus aeronauticus]SHK06365.1 stage IV sporulation protein B [Desulforamulus aeronauticus DSM 10349]
MDYRKNKTPVLLVAIAFLGLCLQLPFQMLNHLPIQQRVSVGDKLSFDIGLPKYVEQNLLEYSIKNNEKSISMIKTESLTPVAATPGQLDVQVKLLGFIPVRHMTVSVVPEIRVIPGGQAVGVMVESEGVMVVGRSAIVDEQGKRHNPAAEAGVQLGDTLLKINDQIVETENQAQELINNMGKDGKALGMEFKDRDSHKIYHTKITPIYCKETRRYRVGLFVRDSTAGVGTMTFYDPESKSYGALGHIISDIDTCRPINLSKGKVVGAQIEGIRMGKKGQPGEKMGVFQRGEGIVGNITKNTNCGIFGKLDKAPENTYMKDAIPVAMANQVKEGPAEIYTVLQGNKIEKYSITVEQINLHGRAEGKGMIIQITDQNLLKKTGGIIQGMSGSPIIQDGRLIGAVTHVFVNDPTRGYGVMAEWMLYDSGAFPKHVSERKKAEFDARRNVACLINQNLKF